MPRRNHTSDGLDLPTRLAGQIIDYAKMMNFEIGSHLAEQALATAFKVSRTPIRQALQFLEAMDVVEAKPHRGFFLKKSGDELQGAVFGAIEGDEDPLYFQIAEDRLAGTLSARFTETEMLRRYNVTRARLLRLLARMAKEGWLDRLPGQGWEFQPILASARTYEQSYRFRMLIEPAALREPTYEVDPVAFARARAQQQAMLDGGIFRYSRAETFQIGAAFHETLVRCSNNAFLLDSIQRVNRVRRLIEYRVSKDRTRLVHECKDHLYLLDLVEGGRREEAAAFLEEHLGKVKLVKLDLASGFIG